MADFVIRPATANDLAAVDELLARSYPVLLKPDYPPSVLVTALPLISRANPALVTSGTYYVAEEETGTLLGAGGWTRGAPTGIPGTGNRAHVRHVVTDHRAQRRGVGRALMGEVFARASETDATHLNCLSTYTAVPFYRALGFVEIGPREVVLRQGIVFPSIEMERPL